MATGRTVGIGAAAAFAAALVVVATEDVYTALVPAMIGFGLLWLVWRPMAVLRRVGTFVGSIVVMGAVLYSNPSPRSALVTPDMTPEQAERLESLGTSTGFPEFLSRMLNLEFGYSPYFDARIQSIVAERLPNTVALLVVALALAGLVVAALWYTTRDREAGPIVDAIAHLGSGLSPFVWLLGFVLLAVTFEFGSTTFATVEQRDLLSVDTVVDLLFPALALALPLAGHAARELRAARSETRPATLPTFSAHWVHLSYLVGATVVVETLYAIPGVGRLWLTGIFNQDPFVSLAAAFVLTVVGLFALLVRDALGTAAPWGVSPWSHRHHQNPNAGTAVQDGGTPRVRSLPDAVSASRKAKLGVALLGVAVALGLFGLVTGPPDSSGQPIGIRTPGFGDLAGALGTIVYQAGIGIAVAAVAGVPIGALLRGSGQARTAVRDLLRAFAALPLLVLVYHLLPVLFQHGIVGDRTSGESVAVAIGVALVPFVALSTVELVGTTANRPETERSSGPPRTVPDGGRRSRASMRDRERAGQGDPGSNDRRPRDQSQTGQARAPSEPDPGHDGGREPGGDRRRSSGSGRGPGQPTAGGARPSFAPVAIPLCVYFGYAVFLAVSLGAAGLTGITDFRYGLSFILSLLQQDLVAAGPTTYALLVLAVGLPVLGANLLADGLRDVWRSDRAAAEPAGRAGQPQPASGPTGQPGAAQPAPRPGPGQQAAGPEPRPSPERTQRQASSGQRDGEAGSGPGQDPDAETHGQDGPPADGSSD